MPVPPRMSPPASWALCQLISAFSNMASLTTAEIEQKSWRDYFLSVSALTECCGETSLR